MGKDNDRIIVSIHCLTYNHAKYIRRCLEGFVMQQTNFRFEAIVHDDASTDGTTEIVRKYADRYPDIIVPIFESENQYSKGIPGKLTQLLEERSHGDFIAICEGDDYWTDPYKLQKQVAYMNSNPTCMMVCNRTGLLSDRNNRIVGESFCYSNSKKVLIEDAICRGGLFISTCSIMYRHSLKDDYPQYCKDCLIGDYPLQIYSAIKGFIYYYNDVMSIYRVNNSTSWMGKLMKTPIEKLIKRVQSEVNMLNGFANDYPQFRGMLEKRRNICIISNVPNWLYTLEDQNKYLRTFHNEIRSFSKLEILDLKISKIRVRGIFGLNPFRHQRKYSEKINKKFLWFKVF